MHAALTDTPSAADFAALARSSPWRFRSLVFTLHTPGEGPGSRDTRCYLRRPDLLRVESMDGQLRQLVREMPEAAGRPEPAHRSILSSEGANLPDQYVGYVSFENLPRGTEWRAGPMPAVEPAKSPSSPSRGGSSYLLWPEIRREPTFRADGLVVNRGATAPDRRFDAPMWQNYFFVALLDPVEIADDAADVDSDETSRGTVITDVRVVDHHERMAWQATVAPTGSYEPRCGCCSVMRDRRTDRLEWGDDRPEALLTEYPTGYRIRLDVGTGVCVASEALDGDVAGSGHEIVIEEVDAALPDELFDTDRR